MQPIPADDSAVMGDFRRYPGCSVVLACAACRWSKTYRPERVIDRLHALRAGGYPTALSDVAGRVAWPCPGCGRRQWRMQFAWPPGIGAREVKRLADRYRN